MDYKGKDSRAALTILGFLISVIILAEKRINQGKYDAEYQSSPESTNIETIDKVIHQQNDNGINHE